MLWYRDVWGLHQMWASGPETYKPRSSRNKCVLYKLLSVFIIVALRSKLCSRNIISNRENIEGRQRLVGKAFRQCSEGIFPNKLDLWSILLVIMESFKYTQKWNIYAGASSFRSHTSMTCLILSSLHFYDYYCKAIPIIIVLNLSEL